MTTQITTTGTTPWVTKPVFTHFPALFNEKWLDTVFGDFNKAYEAPGVHYPYDILVHHDKEGKEVLEYEIRVALAGLTKDDISIQVKESKLIIDISGDPSQDDKNVAYVRSGISYRKATLRFTLAKEVVTESISCKFKDGLLKVFIPLSKPRSTNITIDVD